MSDGSPIILTVADVRRAGLCTKDMRKWLALKGIDLNRFLETGIAADDPRIAGDAYVEKVIAKKRSR